MPPLPFSPCSCLCPPRALRGALVLAALVWVKPGIAQEPTASPQTGPVAREDAAAAEALFQRGREAVEAEDWDTACSSFRESHRLDPAAGTVMNLAVCEEARQNLAAAWEAWQQALRLLPRSDERRSFAEGRLVALEKDLPYLTISGAPGVPLSVVRDGVQLGRASLGVALPVNPGAHEVTVRSEGHAPRTYRITIAKGQREVLTVEPGAPLAEPTVGAPAERDQRPGTAASPLSQKTWAYLAGGVGALGLGSAVVTGLLLPGTQETVDTECDGTSCTEKGVDAAERGQTLLTLNTASWIVAGVGFTAGAVLFVTAPRDPEHPETAVRLVTTGSRFYLTGGF